MPTYTYKCDVCGTVEDRVRQIGQRDEPYPCPICTGENPDHDGVMKRDQIASMKVNSTDQEYHTPVFSNALGVHPSQIKDAQRRFPHHEFAPDGRMILRSHNQRKKVLRDLGFYDKDGY